MSSGNECRANVAVMSENTTIDVSFVFNGGALLCIGRQNGAFAWESDPDVSCEEPFGFVGLFCNHRDGVADGVVG